MKTINLSVREWQLFKEIAKFWYEFSVKSGVIIIRANIVDLSELGY